MTVLKILKHFLLICILIKIIQSIPVEKWHETDNLPTFFIESERKYNWYEAWNECAIRNMTLIAVDTSEKNSAITTILKNKFGKTSEMWIGGHDLAELDKFIWISTGKRFEFTNWTKGAPDHNNNVEHCVHYYDQTDYEWNDANCNHKKGFICEENLFLLKTRRDLRPNS